MRDRPIRTAGILSAIHRLPEPTRQHQAAFHLQNDEAVLKEDLLSWVNEDNQGGMSTRFVDIYLSNLCEYINDS
jgi:hypothetical protein